VTLNLDKSTWKRVAFGDVVANRNVTVKNPASEGIERVIAMEHLNPGELKITRCGSLDDGTTFTKRVRTGQTLFGKRRAYQRKAAYAEFDAICSSDILVFEADGNHLLPEFLPFLVQSSGFYDHALGTSAGSLSPRTNWHDLANYEFDLPPIGEQQRIADLLWAAEHESRAVSQLLAAAERALRAQRCELLSLGEVAKASDVFDIELGRQRHPKYQTGINPVPYMRSANIKRGVISTEDVLTMDFTPTDIKHFGLTKGDVLVTEGCGSPLELGAPARWLDEIEGPVCFQKTLLRYRPRTTDPDWLWQWAQFAFDEGHFRDKASGTGILHITQKRAREMLVRVPDRGTQRRVARLLGSFDEARAQVELRLESTKALARSLSRDVFGASE
jgi:type I restriction enzyme, S subunit